MCWSRRQFVKAACGLSAALTLNHSPLLLASALTDEQQLDNERRRRAKFKLLFASPYRNDDHGYIPHMHLEFKAFVEELSQGKIYVDIQDAGRLGIGTELMAAVTRGQIDAALISVANLSRALPLLDILNIPFWASDNQAYLNLVTSPYWQDHILAEISRAGVLEVLYHYVVGARTLSTIKARHPLITLPEDLQGVTLRVPASRVLAQFYSMTAAHVIEVPWGNVASMARSGHIDALDPGIVGLFAGPDNLRHEIGTINPLQTVPDAWVNVVNQQWLNSLPLALKTAMRDAALLTFKAHLAQVSRIEQHCAQYFRTMGVQIHQPTLEQRQRWQQQFGHHQPSWRAVKQQLLGGEGQFAELLAATKQPSAFSIK